ncbi:alpha/beta hydrolase domain-containing protein [Nocardia sp. NPDC057353]|uniref:alpha/beta hydrolase domain-containing protein n=1 Tax=Nocardia sp. NPDC057353 TaxID=3346104 RepID=UPI003632CFCB
MRDPILTPIDGVPNLLLGSYDLSDLGYAAREVVIEGTASSYAPAGELAADGRWTVTPAARAEYATRAVTVVPTDAARFNGTVVVEWLNVSGGLDAPAVWLMAHRELARAGYAYVGVSAQRVGIEGGPGMVGDFSLKTVDPQRYGRLNHPGDEFSFDIFGQLGTVVRHRSAELLGGLHPERVLAVGESQSAMFLTTYLDAVAPRAGVFDGFLVHSRFGPAAPLDGGSLLDPATVARLPLPRFRTDLRVPVLAVITETDLLGGVLPGYFPARQPAGEYLRVWEIPGAAHADNYTIQGAFLDNGLVPVEELAEAYRPTSMLMGRQLAHFRNFAPQHHYVLHAAIARLHDWVGTGRPAPEAPPIDLTDGDRPAIVTDHHGVACGGLRTPWVDVPLAVTSGSNAEADRMASLFGSGTPFDADHLARLYPGGPTEYLTAFTAALDRAIDAGFIVSADRPEILELAALTARRHFAA